MRLIPLLLMVMPLSLHATPKETVDLLFATREIRETALAPDGGRLAWVEKVHAPDRTPSENRTIQVLDPGAAEPRRITAGDGRALHEEKNVSWSADGAQLAFLSGAR